VETLYLDAKLENMKENNKSMAKFYVTSKNMLL
jgi:hypothetical protein